MPHQAPSTLTAGSPVADAGEPAVRLTGLPRQIGQATTVTVTLPPIVYRFEAGHRIRLTVASADASSLTMIGALAAEGTTTQDYCAPTIDLTSSPPLYTLRAGMPVTR